MLYLAVRIGDATGIKDVSDSLGNQWQMAGSIVEGNVTDGYEQLSVWYARAVKSGACTVRTRQFAGYTNRGVIVEYVGVPLDVEPIKTVKTNFGALTTNATLIGNYMGGDGIFAVAAAQVGNSVLGSTSEGWTARGNAGNKTVVIDRMSVPGAIRFNYFNSAGGNNNSSSCICTIFGTRGALPAPVRIPETRPGRIVTAPRGKTYQDNFSGTALGAWLSPAESNGNTMVPSGGLLKLTLLNYDGSILYGADVSADQWSEVTLGPTSATGTGTGYGVCVRRHKTIVEYYRVCASQDGWRLVRFVGGSFVGILLTSATPGFVEGDRLRLEVRGSLLTVKKNGQTLGTIVNTEIWSGYVGVAASSTVNAGDGIDSWRGGSLLDDVPLIARTTPRIRWDKLRG
jgi:hypothetical protein